MQGEIILQGELVDAEAPPQSYAVLQGEIVAAEAPPQPQPYATAQPGYGQPQPVYSQPAPVAMPPAALQTVQVQIPAGMRSNQVFNVQANGQTIPVTVPPGCRPGGLLTVQVPPAVTVQQPVVQQPGQTIVVQQHGGLKPGFAPAGAPPAGEVMNRATSHTLQSIAGTWVPTRLDDWRGCPVGKEAFVKTYKYVVQGNGDWVDELYPPHRGHVEPAEESGLYEGYGVEPGRYPAKWRLQPDGVLVMAWGDQYQVVYYLVREGDPRASGPSGHKYDASVLSGAWMMDNEDCPGCCPRQVNIMAMGQDAFQLRVGQSPMFTRDGGTDNFRSALGTTALVLSENDIKLVPTGPKSNANLTKIKRTNMVDRAARAQTVQVQIPAGMMPGSVFEVQANGQRIRVTVPAGGKAGQLLNVRVPQQRPIGR